MYCCCAALLQQLSESERDAIAVLSEAYNTATTANTPAAADTTADTEVRVRYIIITSVTLQALPFKHYYFIIVLLQ